MNLKIKKKKMMKEKKKGAAGPSVLEYLTLFQNYFLKLFDGWLLVDWAYVNNTPPPGDWRLDGGWIWVVVRVREGFVIEQG
jgi:hypothetical protein